MNARSTWAFGCASRFGDQPGGEVPRLLVDKSPVQERQRLRPGGGDDPLLTTARGVGPVEQLDLRNSQAALGEDVNAAPRLLAPVRLAPALRPVATGPRARRWEESGKSRGRPSACSTARSLPGSSRGSTSASRRRCRCRQSNVLSGSSLAASGTNADDR